MNKKEFEIFCIKEFEKLCVDESEIITEEAWNNIKINKTKEIQDDKRTIRKSKKDSK